MSMANKDAPLPKDYSKILLLDKHVKFLNKYAEDREDFDYVMSEFLRINGIFWSLSAMDLMGHRAEAKVTEVSKTRQGQARPNLDLTLLLLLLSVRTDPGVR